MSTAYVSDPSGVSNLNKQVVVESPEFDHVLLVHFEDGTVLRVEKVQGIFKSSGVTKLEAKTKTELDEKLSSLSLNFWGIKSFATDSGTNHSSNWPVGDVEFRKNPPKE